MIVRNSEFDNDMIELFIERLIDSVGNAYDTNKYMEGVAYGGAGLEKLFKYKADIERLENTIRNLRADIEHLIDENDDYAYRIVEYNRTLSKMRLDEWRLE